MSRIGRLPVIIPKGVTVTVSDDNTVTVKGPLGQLSQTLTGKISLKQENGEIIISRADDERQNVALHGLYRALIFNMVKGVTTGYEKALLVAGVGYKVIQQGKKIILNIGYSHPIEVEEPNGITFALASPTEIVVKGIDKELVGQTAANIKAARPVEPYHNYGIRYKTEKVVKKEGKTAGKK
ncbi:MAG: 50S ribosomal protein L6 [Clostridiales bacterium]|jgi:large subunit ribosomal protein L6|nr:50S ribosomal protein L6 [Clostridiales bacterium]